MSAGNIWDEVAPSWDEEFGDEGDLWHRTLINPPLLRLLGDVAGQRILDIACGNGQLSRVLARQGASVVGVDLSDGMIAQARRRESAEPLGITYHVVDAARMDEVAAGPFDQALSNMGLIDMPDAAVEGTVAACVRLLRPGGSLVFSMGHPCYDLPERSGWLIEVGLFKRETFRKVGCYLENYSFSLPIKRDWIGKWETDGYHRPLNWYAATLFRHGFAITGLEEPIPNEEFAQRDPESYERNCRIPLIMVVRATLMGH